jgi:hypothetical protein
LPFGVLPKSVRARRIATAALPAIQRAACTSLSTSISTDRVIADAGAKSAVKTNDKRAMNVLHDRCD